MTGIRYELMYIDDTSARVTFVWIVSSQELVYNFSLVLLVLTLLQAPPASSRPPVIEYAVSANVTVEMNVTNNTEFVIQIMPPRVITFTVNAVNILGNGKESSVTSELAWMLLVRSNILLFLMITCIQLNSSSKTWYTA